MTQRHGKVTFVISSLEAGGAQRVLAELANDLCGRGLSISLVTTGFYAGEDWYPVDARIERVRLNKLVPARRKGVFTQVRRLLALRSAIKALGPTRIVSFMAEMNVVVLLATWGLGIPALVSERADPRHHRIGPVWNLLRKVIYPWAARVVVQTESVARWMREHIPRARVAVLPNPIPRQLLEHPVPPLPAGPERRLVAMGRLSEEKQFGLLIDIFAKLAIDFPNWTLWIWGEGRLRRALEDQVRTLGLQSRVLLPGGTREPWSEVAKADVFVLPSRYEGFPNVMLEAMALGRPCVAFDCQSGPRELSRDGTRAALAPANDARALQKLLETMMRDAATRSRFALLARSVRDDFDATLVCSTWIDLLDMGPLCGKGA